MVLKLVRKKKAISKIKAKPKRPTNAQRFVIEIDAQIDIAKGKKVKAGRGIKKSWIEDGADYGVKSVLVPRAGNKKLYPGSAIQISSGDGVKELTELRKDIAAGKLLGKVNALYRKPKKKT
jgi:hypothetical protein